MYAYLLISHYFIVESTYFIIRLTKFIFFNVFLNFYFDDFILLHKY